MNLNIISNLANGSNSNDAVNLSQLQSVQSSIPTKLSDLSVLNTANINLNSNKIINVVDPVNAQDVSTKNYVDNKVSSVVVPTKLSDLSVLNTANLNLNSYKIINVVDPTNSQDGATKNYVDNKVSSLTSADFNLNTHKITNLVDPVNLQDGATKNYVDTKVASYGSTLTQTLNTTAYNGSLAGITCKILWINNNNTVISFNNLNSLIINLGGNPTNITIYFLNNVSTSTTLTYDSSFDVVIWVPNVSTSFPNVITLLNTYYNNGKGVVISMYATSSNTSLTKNISTSSNQLSSFTANYTQLIISHPILNGCTTLVSPTYANSTFTSQNSSTIIGSFGGSTGVLAYLDDNSLGRRVDLNYLAGDGTYVSNDTTTTGLLRLTLQALLWAAKKINSASSTTSNFDPNIMQLVNNLNCNNKNISNCADPINLQDVMTLNYYNNLKPSGTLLVGSSYYNIGYIWNGLKFFVSLVGGTASQAIDFSIIPNKNTSGANFFIYAKFYNTGTTDVYLTSHNNDNMGFTVINLYFINNYAFIYNPNSSNVYYKVY